jgi:hypothetical protein
MSLLKALEMLPAMQQQDADRNHPEAEMYPECPDLWTCEVLTYLTTVKPD